MSDNDSTLLALAHFACTGVAVLVADLADRKAIDPRTVTHLQALLAQLAAEQPENRRPVFQTLSETIAGKHYRDR